VRAVSRALRVSGLENESTRPRSPDYRLRRIPAPSFPGLPLPLMHPRTRLLRWGVLTANLSPRHSGGPRGPRAADCWVQVRSKVGGRGQRGASALSSRPCRPTELPQCRTRPGSALSSRVATEPSACACWEGGAESYVLVRSNELPRAHVANGYLTRRPRSRRQCP